MNEGVQPERRGMQMNDVAAINSEKATFTIKVQFTCNATWQGTISWLEGKKTQQFRSELEMIKLMMEAIHGEEAHDLNTW